MPLGSNIYFIIIIRSKFQRWIELNANNIWVNLFTYMHETLYSLFFIEKFMFFWKIHLLSKFYPFFLLLKEIWLCEYITQIMKHNAWLIIIINISIKSNFCLILINDDDILITLLVSIKSLLNEFNWCDCCSFQLVI